MRYSFTKMEGAGNDYIYVDAVRQPFPLARAPELARAWSDRHFGIGGDGLILLAPSAAADVRMIMFNADGSRGAMCGNGLRCAARLAYDLGLAAATRLRVETDTGVHAVELIADGGQIFGARTELTNVTASATAEPVPVAGIQLDCHPGSAGNPHAVVFVDDVDETPVRPYGAALQANPRFADGVNVEFVQVLADGSLKQRTFERGSGETLACGTGAAVAALTAIRTGRVAGPDVTVHLRGGALRIVCGDRALVIEGPARTVFRGEIDLDPD